MIKKLILFLLCLCMLFTAGCSYANTHTREEPVPTLNIASSFSSDIAAQTYQALSSTFASRYGLQILDNSTLSGDAYTQKIINDFAAGNEPDVFYYPVDAAQTMIENGQVVSLEEIRRVYPQYATTLQAGILEQLADENGHNWCVPILGTYQALYCNVELFEIYGAPLPYTWTDLMTAIDIFQKYNIVPIAAGFRDNTQFWLDHLILSYGTFEHSAVPLDIDDVPHTWGQALVQLPRLNAMEAFPGNVTTLSHASAQTLFSSGRAAMILDSSDHLSLLGNEDTLIALSIPCQPPASAQKHLLVEYTSGLYISRKAWENSTLRDAAVQFVMYMSSQEAVYRLIEDGAGYPALSRERLTTMSSQNPLTQSVLELALSSQLHTSISHRLNRKAWVSLNSSMVQLYQGYSDIGRVLDDLIKYNSNQP